MQDSRHCKLGHTLNEDGECETCKNFHHPQPLTSKPVPPLVTKKSFLLDGDVEGIERFLNTHSNYGPLFCAWERVKKELKHSL